MAEYFPEIADLEDAPTTLVTGEREATLNNGEWQIAPHYKCNGCSAFESHQVPGRHFCTSQLATNPIIPEQLMWNGFMMQVQHFISYFGWITHGLVGIDSIHNSSSFNNFTTNYSWPIVSVSGNVVTCKIAVGTQDPRRVLTHTIGGYEEPSNPLSGIIFTDNYGAWCSPGDQADISGNSVLASRISTQILSRNFSGLSNPTAAINDTFTVTLKDQTVANALTKLIPESEDGVSLTIYRDAYHPELFENVQTFDALHYVDYSVEYTEMPVDGLFILKTPQGLDCRIGIPITDYEPRPGSATPTTQRGNFKVQVTGIDGTVTDVTSACRSYKNGDSFYRWPRVKIFPYDGVYRTVIDLNGLLSGATKVVINYGYEVANGGIENAHSGVSRRCLYDFEDYTKVIAAGQDVVGVGVRGDRHFACFKRADVPVEVIEKYQPGNCTMMTFCPFYRPQTDVGPFRENAWANLISAGNMYLKQMVPFDSSPNNFIVDRLRNPSFYWLASSGDGRPNYKSPVQRQASTQYFAGGYGWYDILTHPTNGDTIDWHFGPDNDYSVDPVDYIFGTNHAPYGLFRRSLGTTYVANRQDLDSQYSDTFGQKHLGRRVAPVYKDRRIYGDSPSFSMRDASGIEGLNRVQRVNRTSVSHIPNCDKTILTEQPSADWDHIKIYSTPVTRFGKSIKAEIKLFADGNQDFGAKRILGGFNGSAWRLEPIGGGIFRIHCNLGAYMVAESQVGVDGDTLKVFYGSGNVVKLPWPYAMEGYYNNINYRIHGGDRQNGACEGDTIRFTHLPDFDFPITAVSPSSGDDLSGITTKNLIHSGYAGSFFQPYAEDQGSEITITRYEVLYTGAYTIGNIQEINPGGRQFIGSAQDFPTLIHESGSGFAYLSYYDYHFPLTFQGDVSKWKFRVTYFANGVSKIREFDIVGPYTTLSETADSATTSQWSVSKYDNGVDTLLTFGANVTGSSWDFNNWPSQGFWNFNVSTNEVIVHPNDTGLPLTINYQTVSEISLADFPSGVGYPNVTERDYLKLCDTILIKDQGGYLASLNLNQISGAQFDVRTSCCLDFLNPHNVQYCEKGLETWHTISSEEIVVCEGTGKIYLTDVAFDLLPTNFCLKHLGNKMNRTKENSASQVQMLGSMAGCLDTVRVTDITNQLTDLDIGAFSTIDSSDYQHVGSPPDGFGCEGPFDGDPVPNTNSPGTDPCETGHVWYPTDVVFGWACDDVDYRFEICDGALSPLGIGAGDATNEIFLHSDSLGGVFTNGSVQARFPLPIINFDNLLKRLPSNAIIDNAHIEISVDNGLWKERERRIFWGQNTSLLQIMPWMLFTKQNDFKNYPDGPWLLETENNQSMTISIMLVGLTNQDKWVHIGTFGDVSSTLYLNKNSVIPCKTWLQQILSLKDSVYKDFGFYFAPYSIDTPQPPLPTSAEADQQSFLLAVRRSYEKIENVSSGGDPRVYYINTLGDIAPELLIEMPHITFIHKSSTFSCDGVTFGNLAIVYHLPDSSIRRYLTYGNWPTLQERG